MAKFGVFVCRCGYIQIEAENEEEAAKLVENEHDTEKISWNDSWEIDDVLYEEE